MFEDDYKNPEPSYLDSLWSVRLTESDLTIYHPESGLYSANALHPQWREIRRCIIAEAYGEAVDLIDISASYASALHELDLDQATISINPISGVMTASGRSISPAVQQAVARLVRAGNAAAPLRKFFERLSMNPSATAWEETILFMEANEFQLFEDGRILGYKGVRTDMTDCRTGTFNNTPGQVCSMPRQQVDDDRRVSCSTGLHVAAFEYAQRFGPVTVIVAVDPADVVSIPFDYNNQKMRTCAYEVIATLQGEQKLVNDANVFRVQDLAF